jgi:hypothetical protein
MAISLSLAIPKVCQVIVRGRVRASARAFSFLSSGVRERGEVLTLVPVVNAEKECLTGLSLCFIMVFRRSFTS